MKSEKHSKKIALIGLTSLLYAFSSQVIADKSTECDADHCYQDHPLLNAQPEFGVDLGFGKAQFKQGHGDKMLNKNLMPINVFFGLNFTEHFGFEVGYGETRRKHTTVTLGAGEFSPGGDEIQVGNYQVYDTSLSVSQPYVSLKYKYPLGEKVQLFGAIGVTSMKLHASWENIDDTGVAPEADDKTNRTKKIENRKTIPLCRFGLYVPLSSSFSLRLITTWYQTSKLQKYVPASINGLKDLITKEKDSLQYSLGIVYMI